MLLVAHKTPAVPPRYNVPVAAAAAADATILPLMEAPPLAPAALWLQYLHVPLQANIPPSAVQWQDKP